MKSFLEILKTLFEVHKLEGLKYFSGDKILALINHLKSIHFEYFLHFDVAVLLMKSFHLHRCKFNLDFDAYHLQRLKVEGLSIQI